MSSFVIASCKTWHIAQFEQFVSSKERTNDKWYYVGTKDELTKLLNTVTPRYIFFLHWNWIVPSKIWRSIECVCFHMTDLPYGRGGSPLQNLILNGKKETKVTAFRMTGDIDAGPTYEKVTLTLDGTAEEIYIRTGQLCWQIVDFIVKNSPVPKAQEGKPIYFERRTPDQSSLPLHEDVNRLYDFIRMLDAPGYPHAFININGCKLEFTNARLKDKQLNAEVKITRNTDEQK